MDEVHVTDSPPLKPHITHALNETTAAAAAAAAAAAVLTRNTLP